MFEQYEPTSDFLKAIVADEVPLGDGPFASANLRQLIDMTRDPDTSNRDWAAMLLAGLELDTPEVRKALIDAAEDVDNCVRAEAILGLARRDRSLALPLVQRELSGDYALLPVFEAAELLADASLVSLLEHFAGPSDDQYLHRVILSALAACRSEQSAG